jgi:hypothetical protein
MDVTNDDLRATPDDKIATSQTAISHISGPVVRLDGFALGDKVVVRDGDGRVWRIAKLAPATERAEAFAILEYGTPPAGSSATFRLSRLAHAEASVSAASPVDLLAEFRALLDKAVEATEAPKVKPKTRRDKANALDYLLSGLDTLDLDLALIRSYNVEVISRIVRRAKYDALHAMLEATDKWVAGAQENCTAMEHGPAARHDDGRACGETFYVADIRNMVNDAARQVGTREPYRPEAT